MLPDPRMGNRAWVFLFSIGSLSILIRDRSGSTMKLFETDREAIYFFIGFLLSRLATAGGEWTRKREADRRAKIDR